MSAVHDRHPGTPADTGPSSRSFSALSQGSLTGWNQSAGGLAAMGPTDGQSKSREFMIELVINLVVMVISILVCLQLIVSAQLSLERSGAIAQISQTSTSLVENWQSGSDLPALQQRFGGVVQADSLTICFNRRYETVDATSPAAYYQLVFSVQRGSNGYASGRLELRQLNHDALLMAWTVGRFHPGNNPSSLLPAGNTSAISGNYGVLATKSGVC